MFPKLFPLLLKLSSGGTPATFVSVMLDGFGAVNGPIGQVQRADVPPAPPPVPAAPPPVPARPPVPAAPPPVPARPLVPATPPPVPAAASPVPATPPPVPAAPPVPAGPPLPA